MPDRPQDEELAEMLEPKLGTEATTALMNAIPTLDHIDARFDGIHGEIAGLRVSVDRLQEVLDYRLTGLAHELTAVFRGELNSTVTSQTRTTIFALVATMLTLCGFFLTAFAIR